MFKKTKLFLTSNISVWLVLSSLFASALFAVSGLVYEKGIKAVLGVLLSLKVITRQRNA